MKLRLEFSFLKACVHFSVGVVLWDRSLPSWIQAVVSKFNQQHFICLSVCVCLSIYHLYTYLLSLYLFIYLPIYLPTYLCVYLSIYVSVTLSIYLSIYHLSIRIRDKRLKAKEGQQASHISHSLLLHGAHHPIPTSPPY